MNEHDEHAALLSLAVESARLAGALVLDLAGGAEGHARLRREATAKSSSTDLVSRADQASEELIVNRLHAARPDDGIVAEEGRQSSPLIR